MSDLYKSKEHYFLLKPGQRLRASGQEQLDLNIGRQEDSKLFIELIGEFNPERIKSTSAIEVEQTALAVTGEKRIRFILQDISLEDNFYQLVDDLIESTKGIINSSQAYFFIVNRFTRWKKLFLSHSRLNEKEIQGLIGELLFLKNYAIPHFGENLAIQGWSGAEYTTKDFSYGSDWFEIKTTSTQKREVVISSFEQLESDFPGHLVIYCLEKMSSASNGVTLNNLVREILNSICLVENKDTFKNLLLDYHYIFGSNEEYDSYVYRIESAVSYKVSLDFPKISRKQIDKRIQKIAYAIPLSEIIKYKEDLKV